MHRLYLKRFRNCSHKESSISDRPTEATELSASHSRRSIENGREAAFPRPILYLLTYRSSDLPCFPFTPYMSSSLERRIPISAAIPARHGSIRGERFSRGRQKDTTEARFGFASRHGEPGIPSGPSSCMLLSVAPSPGRPVARLRATASGGGAG